MHMPTRPPTTVHPRTRPRGGLLLPRVAGVEYIISRRLYEGLPEEEKRYWHSHVYEVRAAAGPRCSLLLQQQQRVQLDAIQSRPGPVVLPGSACGCRPADQHSCVE